jgi:CRP-like cAMP-binding protein
MQPAESEKSYHVWGSDHVVYGPISLAKVTEWLAIERVLPESWIFSNADGAWQRAGERPELAEALKRTSARPRDSSHKKSREERRTVTQLLRELELFKGLTEAQIESFATYAQIVRVNQFMRIAKKGEPGDSMFIVLEGEVRAYLMVDGRECTLSCVGPGEFLGEISLLDEGPRSADLAVNVDTTLLRIPTARFAELLKEAPALAAPFLLALSRSVVARIRKTTQRYEDSIHFFGRKISS